MYGIFGTLYKGERTKLPCFGKIHDMDKGSKQDAGWISLNEG